MKKIIILFFCCIIVCAYASAQVRVIRDFGYAFSASEPYGAVIYVNSLPGVKYKVIAELLVTTDRNEPTNWNAIREEIKRQAAIFGGDGVIMSDRRVLWEERPNPLSLGFMDIRDYGYKRGIDLMIINRTYTEVVGVEYYGYVVRFERGLTKEELQELFLKVEKNLKDHPPPTIISFEPKVLSIVKPYLIKIEVQVGYKKFQDWVLMIKKGEIPDVLTAGLIVNLACQKDDVMLCYFVSKEENGCWDFERVRF